MKALAFIRLGGQHQREVRKESLTYTAGILTAFLLLAATLLTLRALGIQAGWGFQLQSPIFVTCIAYLVFLSALSLAGVFEITAGTNFAARLAQKHSFFTGLLAVLLATPCTAPFMGGAIAAALAAPPITALGIFLFLGLGLATPFLLLALIPGFTKMLPRPGAWMRHLQRALSLPMFATALWLAWVLNFQSGPFGVLLLALGAAALYLAVTKPRLRPAALVACLVLPILPTTAATPQLTLPNAKPFSESTLAAAQATHQPVLIDITAAWCVTCLVNEHSTLAAPKIQSYLAAHHVQLLVGDWTSRSQSITTFLAQNHRDGVPLYVYIPPTGPQKILPQILTPDIVESAIN
jgi:thiol:disulfide interchange protein DsbD